MNPFSVEDSAKLPISQSHVDRNAGLPDLGLASARRSALYQPLVIIALLELAIAVVVVVVVAFVTILFHLVQSERPVHPTLSRGPDQSRSSHSLARD